jgi:hypothetical protein
MGRTVRCALSTHENILTVRDEKKLSIDAVNSAVRFIELISGLQKVVE